MRPLQLYKRQFCSQLQKVGTETPVSPQTVRRGGSRKLPNFQFTLAQAGVVFAAGSAILAMVKMGEMAMERRKRASQQAIVSEEHIGTPKLGGPWTLYDSRTAAPFTSEDLKGKYQLIYFGFTYCPDICPEELEKQKTIVENIDRALIKMGKPAGLVQPLFITVDPKRDTLAQTRMYVEEFHPKLIGLTGPPELVKRVTRLFRVYYNEGIRTSNADGEEDYLVDHSIIHYLMGPNNEFVDFYGKNFTAEEITQKIVGKISASSS